MGYAFISYSSMRSTEAAALYNLLKKNGIDAWMAPGDIPVGMLYPEVLNRAISNCSCFILLLTKETQTSNWVPKEVERAVSNGKPILPLKLEEVILTDQFILFLSSHQMLAVNPLDEKDEATRSVLKAVKSYTGESEKNNSYSIDRRLEHPYKVFCSTPAIEIGSVVYERYTVRAFVGTGCYGSTYLADTIDTNKTVAMRVVSKAELKEDLDEYRERISNQVRLLKRIRHPSFAQIIDVIENDAYCVVIMEHIEGTSLAQWCHENKPNEQTVIRLGRELCEAAGYLHTQKPPIIHCNLGPPNIMVRRDGKLMISNLDQARELTDEKTSGFRWGSFQFAAPECYGGEVDERSDIFTIGMTLFVLSSQREEKAGSFRAVMSFDEMRSCRVYNPAFSKELLAVIDKCCAFDPQDRYQSAFELLCALTKLENAGIPRQSGQSRRADPTVPESRVPIATGEIPESQGQFLPIKSGETQKEPLHKKLARCFKKLFETTP